MKANDWVTKEPRFYIGSDDDGHHYIIPVDKADEWSQWLEAGDYEQLPGWAVSIGGSITLVSFTDWRIK